MGDCACSTFMQILLPIRYSLFAIPFLPKTS